MLRKWGKMCACLSTRIAQQIDGELLFGRVEIPTTMQRMNREETTQHIPTKIVRFHWKQSRRFRRPERECEKPKNIVLRKVSKSAADDEGARFEGLGAQAEREVECLGACREPRRTGAEKGRHAGELFLEAIVHIASTVRGLARLLPLRRALAIEFFQPNVKGPSLHLVSAQVHASVHHGFGGGRRERSPHRG